MSNNEDKNVGDGRGSSNQDPQQPQPVEATATSSNDMISKGLPGVESTTPLNENPSDPCEFSQMMKDIEQSEKRDIEEQISLIRNDCDPLEKKLEMSDTSVYLNRLALSEEKFNAIILPVLNEEEKSSLDYRIGIEVDVYDIKVKRYQVNLNYDPGSKIYLLTGEWRKFYRAFELKPYKYSIKLWVFRGNSADSLCFYIATFRENESESESVTLETTVPERPLEVVQLEKQLKLVYENEKPLTKQLNESDTNEDQDTLALPTEAVKSIIFPWLKVHGRLDVLREGLNLDVYDTLGEKYHMMFKYDRNSISYCLTGGWKSLCNKYKLTADEDHVDLWAFRHYCTQKLCFHIEVKTTKMLG